MVLFFVAIFFYSNVHLIENDEKYWGRGGVGDECSIQGEKNENEGEEVIGSFFWGGRDWKEKKRFQA